MRPAYKVQGSRYLITKIVLSDSEWNVILLPWDLRGSDTPTNIIHNRPVEWKPMYSKYGLFWYFLYYFRCLGCFKYFGHYGNILVTLLGYQWLIYNLKTRWPWIRLFRIESSPISPKVPRVTCNPWWLCIARGYWRLVKESGHVRPDGLNKSLSGIF